MSYVVLLLASLFVLVVGANIGHDAVINEIADPNEDKTTDAALYEGFVNGFVLNFDYVSLGKHVEEDENVTDKEMKKEHLRHIEEAKIEADYLTKHRPLESAVVPENEADLYSMFNILLHYLTSRSQTWSLKEPGDVGLKDNNEHHMVFVSESNHDENQPIPRNMLFAVGNMQKRIPTKPGKTPIILTCLESFIVCRLSFSIMSKLLSSTAPVDMKLKLVDRWIHMAQKHFILYLPYVTITAQRCYDILKGNGENESINPDYSTPVYENLLQTCKAMVDKRDNENDLQTFVMLDSELHCQLIKRCLKEEHIIPSLLKERNAHIKKIHKTMDKEMDWEVFSSAANMLLAKLEKDIINDRHKLLSPSTWGCDMSKKEAANAEKDLIGIFIATQNKLNLKIKSTVMALNKLISDASEDDGKSLAESMKRFTEHEYMAAKEEAKVNADLAECIAVAEDKLRADANKDITDKETSEIVKSLENYEHNGWMACMSARIMPIIKSICTEKPHYCLTMTNQIRKSLNNLEPNSTAALVMENLHTAMCSVLLTNGEMTPAELRKYMAQVAKNEIEELKEINPASSSQSQSPQSSDYQSTPHVSETTNVDIQPH